MAVDNVVPIDAQAAVLLERRAVRFRWFVALLTVVWLSILVPTLIFTPLPPLWPFVALAVLVLLAEHRFVLFGDETSMSASIIVVVASVFVFADTAPLAGPLLIGSLAGLYLPHLRRGARGKAAFNGACMGLAAAAAGSLALGLSGKGQTPAASLTIAGVVVTYWVINNLLVAIYQAVVGDERFLTSARCLLTSETELLAWAAVACVAVGAATNTTVQIALTAATVVLSFATFLRHSPSQGQRNGDSFSWLNVLLVWSAALALRGVDRQTAVEISFALSVALLAGRNSCPRIRLAQTGIPLLTILLASSSALIAVLAGACAIATLALRPRSAHSWSVSVAVAGATVVILGRVGVALLGTTTPTISVVLAALFPALVASMVFDGRAVALTPQRDAWVLLGCFVPSRQDVLAAVFCVAAALLYSNCAAVTPAVSMVIVALMLNASSTAQRTSELASR